MLRVGLTGGFATGKSHVAATLESFGCYIVKADELGHRVLSRGGPAYNAVVTEFGGGILEESGEINRRKLADQVFHDPDRLQLLNNLVHPSVIALEERRIEEIRAKDPEAIVVVEAAILIETGSHLRFDKLILVICSEAAQIERAMRRDNLTEEQVRARIARQMPLEEKRKYADYVIDTSGSREDTYAQSLAVYQSLRGVVHPQRRR